MKANFDCFKFSNFSEKRHYALFKHLNTYENFFKCIFIELNTKFPYIDSLGPYNQVLSSITSGQVILHINKKIIDKNFAMNIMLKISLILPCMA